jgi:hypothetical protein
MTAFRIRFAWQEEHENFRGIQRNEFWKMANRVIDAVKLHYNDDAIKRRRVRFVVETRRTHVAFLMAAGYFAGFSLHRSVL